MCPIVYIVQYKFIMCFLLIRPSESYQNPPMPGVYAYGGYMYGTPDSGSYDYSQAVHYGQYPATSISVSLWAP